MRLSCPAIGLRRASFDSRVHDPFPASAYGGGFRVCLEQRTAVRFSSTCQNGLGIAAKRGPLLRRKAPPKAPRPGNGILRIGGGGVAYCGWAYLFRVDTSASSHTKRVPVCLPTHFKHPRSAP